MQVSSQVEGYTPAGEALQRIILTAQSGARVELTNLGARWVGAWVPASDGRLANVVLGYPHLEDYLTDPNYLGATVGRFANRVADASFLIDDVEYHVDKNDGGNCNHGGLCGLHQRVWDVELLADGVHFSTISPDGEGGWPGRVEFHAEYRWSDDLCLAIKHRATTDRTTWVNLTNHAYFNLTGTDTSVRAHLLMIPSGQILDTTPAYIPTGKIVDVEGTPFDFRQQHAVGLHLDDDNDQLRWNCGYNHCYLLGQAGEWHPAATLSEPTSGRRLSVETDLPAVLLYSAGYLPQPTTGICFETQFYPDTPHHSHFPQGCLLHTDEEYSYTTCYRFGI